MQRLKAYIRRTVLASATEYAYPKKRRTPESTRAAFRDAMRGTDTGWWSDLIYTVDVLAMFNCYRSDVRAAILDLVGETGADLGQRVGRDKDSPTYAELIASTGRRQTWEAYRSGNDSRAREADAACTAVRLAIEYLTGEVASALRVEV